MAIPNCQFEGKGESEEVMAVFRHHWISVLRHIVFFGLFLSFYVYFSFRLGRMRFLFEPLIFHFIFTLCMTLYLHYFFLKIIRYFENVFIITNTRLVEIKEETIDFFDLRSAPDIQKEQEWLIRVILDFGKLNFSGMKVIECVPEPNRYYTIINEVRLKLNPPVQMPEGSQPESIPLDQLENTRNENLEPQSSKKNKKRVTFPVTHTSTLTLNPPPKEGEQIDKTAFPISEEEEE